MNCSVANFLIVLKRSKDIPTGDSGKCRQSAEGSNRTLDTPPIVLRQLFKRGPNARRGDHSVTNGFTMFEPLISRCCFQSMANGVAKVQNAAQITLLLVGHDDFRF